MTFEVREIGLKRKFMLMVKGPQSEKSHLLAEVSFGGDGPSNYGDSPKAEGHVEGKWPLKRRGVASMRSIQPNLIQSSPILISIGFRRFASSF